MKQSIFLLLISVLSVSKAFVPISRARSRRQQQQSSHLFGVMVSMRDFDWKSALASAALALLLEPAAALAVSGGGLDYAGTDISGQDFSGNYKGKDFTQGTCPNRRTLILYLVTREGSPLIKHILSFLVQIFSHCQGYEIHWKQPARLPLLQGLVSCIQLLKCM
jgi:hypothetical protein